MRFRCILADPPWRYDQSPRGAASHHYATMSLEEIRQLPLPTLTEEHAHLHLWVPHSFLPEAFGIMAAWGFTYRSIFVWVKPSAGNGHYWRAAAEFMLFGVKGRAPFLDHSIINWLCCDRGEHSSKPEKIRKLIERVSPGPYLELFGRRPVDNWVVFGNDVRRGMFDEDIAAI
jgi:N6-adenosine-specific RNA methylase IME4